MMPFKRSLMLLLLGGGVLALVACGGQKPQPALPPATPTGLIAAPGDAAVALSWDANTESNLRGYNVYWGVESDTPNETAFVAAPNTTFTVTGLTNGTPYAFAIDAENTSGQKSQRTAPVTATPTGEIDPGPDDPPTVTATNPADGMTDVAINQGVSVTFSKPMNRAATEAAFSAAPEIACAFNWNFTSTSMSCTPQAHLQSDTSYTVTIGTGAMDTQGNALTSPHSFSFTTGSTELQVCVFGESTFGNCVFGP